MKLPETLRPIAFATLSILTFAVAVRSIWFVDTLSWNTLDEAGGSMMAGEWGVQTAQLGLRLFHDERLSPPPTGRARLRPQPIPGDAGVRFTSAGLNPEPTLARWLGMGFEHAVDDRPSAFKNLSSVTLPLWLIASMLAISPVKWIIRRRREVKVSTPSEAQQSGGKMMRISIALIIGLLAGSIGTWLITRPTRSQPQAAIANPAGQVEAPPIHPIVGSWRIRMAPIVATYIFRNDNTFLLSFK